MKISVTQKHIDSGRQQNCFLCPIAKAITEAVAGKLHIIVQPNRVEFKGMEWGGGWRTIELPNSAKEFIKKFDAGKVVEPFDFVLVGM
jgi:hypothetical protein